MRRQFGVLYNTPRDVTSEVGDGTETYQVGISVFVVRCLTQVNKRVRWAVYNMAGGNTYEQCFVTYHQSKQVAMVIADCVSELQKYSVKVRTGGKDE